MVSVGSSGTKFINFLLRRYYKLVNRRGNDSPATVNKIASVAGLAYGAIDDALDLTIWHLFSTWLAVALSLQRLKFSSRGKSERGPFIKLRPAPYLDPG
jgi:hypothetical protein